MRDDKEKDEFLTASLEDAERTTPYGAPARSYSGFESGIELLASSLGSIVPDYAHTSRKALHGRLW